MDAVLNTHKKCRRLLQAHLGGFSVQAARHYRELGHFYQSIDYFHVSRLSAHSIHAHCCELMWTGHDGFGSMFFYCCHSNYLLV